MNSRCLSVLLLTAALLHSQQRLPAIEGETLAGAKVALPAASGPATLLIIGFTRGSQEQTKAWSQRVRGRYPAWSIAVLEDVPGLIRGMVARGIRNGTPKDQHGHFLLVFRGEQQLKQAAGFSRPDDAYLLILDSAGTIRWRFHGAVTDAAMEQLGVVWTQVASVKPATPQDRYIAVFTYPGGRMTITNYSLHAMLQEAFRVQPFQIAGGPPWMEDALYSVEAKPPASSQSAKSKPPYPKAPPNDEQRRMLQTLLIDRFHIKLHRETREGAVYLLTRASRALKLQPPETVCAEPTSP